MGHTTAHIGRKLMGYRYGITGYITSLLGLALCDVAEAYFHQLLQSMHQLKYNELQLHNIQLLVQEVDHLQRR